MREIQIQNPPKELLTDDVYICILMPIPCREPRRVSAGSLTMRRSLNRLSVATLRPIAVRRRPVSRRLRLRKEVRQVHICPLLPLFFVSSSPLVPKHRFSEREGIATFLGGLPCLFPLLLTNCPPHGSHRSVIRSPRSKTPVSEHDGARFF
jgi:hypothetical protein